MHLINNTKNINILLKKAVFSENGGNNGPTDPNDLKSNERVFDDEDDSICFISILERPIK